MQSLLPSERTGHSRSSGERPGTTATVRPAARPDRWQMPLILLGSVAAFLFISLLFASLGLEKVKAADLASTLVFAFGGSLIAGAWLQPRVEGSLARLVLVGIAGFSTANGGGTVRDLLAFNPPFWITAPEYAAWSIFAVLMAEMARVRAGSLLEHTLSVVDLIALGLFVGLGVDKALSLGGPASLALSLPFGTITGCGGGLVRDFILRRPPAAVVTTYGAVAAIASIFHYAQASLWGALSVSPPTLATWIATAAVAVGIGEATRNVRWVDC